MTVKFVVRTFVLTAFFLTGINTALAQQVEKPSKRDQDSATNLYLMRNLEYTLLTWKSPSTDPAELGRWIVTTRNRLNKLKTAAKAYGRDGQVIDAYSDMLDLLEKYENYLVHVVYFDLIAGVARPHYRNFFHGLSEATPRAIEAGIRGSAFGGTMGALAGTAVPLPGIGTVTGAGLGSAIGGFGAAGTVLIGSLLGDDRQSVTGNTKIGDQRRKAAMEVIDLMNGRLESTTKNLITRAKILAGKEKYDWGVQVGFDGSESKSFEDQLELRPNDPFLFVAMATKKASSNPKVAAGLLSKAAQLVPSDADATVDILQKDRAELLLSASRIAEYGSRSSGKRDVELAADAIRYYQAARKCLNNGDSDFSRDSKVVYARACALVGRAEEAERVIVELLKQAPTDPLLLYDCATVKSQLGLSEDALDYLRRSFKALPRWQPQALTDTRLTYVVSQRRSDVETICVNPIVGRWTTDKGVKMEFFRDGSYRQISGSTLKSGNYEIIGQKIRIWNSVKDTSYSFTVSPTHLTLGDTFQASRAPHPLFGAWKYNSDLFEFRDDGTWQKEQNAKVTTGNYSIIPAKDNESPSEIRFFSTEDVVLGSLERRISFRLNGNSLSVLMPNISEPYVYSRK